MEPIELPPESKPIKLRFPEGPRTGKVVLELKNVTAGYGGDPVFSRLNLILEKGEKVALVGPNGAGKSTLMKILAGRLPLSDGERTEGHNVIVSYYSQDQDDLLASENTVWNEVYSVAPSRVVPHLRTLLGCFLFSGDSVEKQVSVLSGGERSRLVLCKLLLSPANCLLLDEPTNHLDIRSKDILMDALREYGGTMVFVSHDRYFLDGLATRVLEVGSGTATTYLGNYEDYLLKKEAEQGEGKGTPSRKAAVENTPDENASDRESNGLPKKKKVNPYRIRLISDKIREIESVIQTHETRIAVLSQMLVSEELYRDYQLFRTTMDEHDLLQEELSQFMDQWEKLQFELSVMDS
jgi:ATP-binding cassette subfamily F protein 3